MKSKVEELEKGKLLITPFGKLDIYTAIDFGQDTNRLIDLYEAKTLILDFEKVTYVSSGGLRIILELQKKMEVLGKMILKNVNPDVKNVFKMTGFDKFLTIEEKN